MKKKDAITSMFPQAARDLLTSPAFKLSLGNTALATETAEPVGIGLNILTSAAVAAGRVYETATGKPVGLPYYVLSAVNGASAASVLVNASETLGSQSLLNLNDASAKPLLAASAFIAWSIGHAVAGANSKHNKTPTHALNNPQTYYGAGDLAAVHGNPIASAIFTLGLIKALGTKPGEVGEIKSFKDFLRKHSTPARMYGAGYLVGALMSLGDPAMILAQFMWGTGYLDFDQNLNKDLLPDMKTVLRQGFHRSLKIIPSFSQNMDNAQLGLDVLKLIPNFSEFLSDLRSGHWDEASELMAGLYKKSEETSKSGVFALLEVLAPYSHQARTFIVDLKQDGDLRAIMKMNRMMANLKNEGWHCSPLMEEQLRKRIRESHPNIPNQATTPINELLVATLPELYRPQHIPHPHADLIAAAKRIIQSVVPEAFGDTDFPVRGYIPQLAGGIVLNGG